MQSETSQSNEALLASLVDLSFREGRHEIARSTGRRGSLKLEIQIELGDNGVPMWTTNSLVFEPKRHAKDGFR